MQEHNNTTSKWHLLTSFKTVIKKVTFLMNSNVNRWRLISAFTNGGGGGGGGSRRRLSFGERLGLTAIVSSSDDDEENDNLEVCDSGSYSKELKKTRSFHVQRTMSFPEEDDVDKRAEMFIENFYRRLRYEKQVSLQLRYDYDDDNDESRNKLFK
ncbi:hypothetical protein L1987_64902 [Smallanthus sonchifolius]|uniref:Uncharacterized protein n=1 Tax=Smallanthus sonchifolius TaxID=185202 RepID=A0ACB9BSY6_9ASTR|nr:hypothetical protein L1987_64902 [Smallanthus sonchifolius]